MGNTAYVALALLKYFKKYGGEEYLALAEKIMGWVLDNCADGTPVSLPATTAGRKATAARSTPLLINPLSTTSTHTPFSSSIYA